MERLEKVESDDPREILRFVIGRRRMYFSEDTIDNTFSFLLGFISGAEMYKPNFIGRVWNDYTSWMYFKFQLEKPSINELKNFIIHPKDSEAFFDEFYVQADVSLLH